MVSLAMLLVGDVEAVEVGLLGSRWMQKASERETERESEKAAKSTENAFFGYSFCILGKRRRGRVAR